MNISHSFRMPHERFKNAIHSIDWLMVSNSDWNARILNGVPRTIPKLYFNSKYFKISNVEINPYRFQLIQCACSKMCFAKHLGKASVTCYNRSIDTWVFLFWVYVSLYTWLCLHRQHVSLSICKSSITLQRAYMVCDWMLMKEKESKRSGKKVNRSL